MTSDEQKQFDRLKHHIEGLQRTVFEQGDRIAEQNETIKIMGIRNQELRDRAKELMAK